MVFYLKDNLIILTIQRLINYLNKLQELNCNINFLFENKIENVL